MADQKTDDDNARGNGVNIAGRDMRSPYDPGSTRWRSDAPDSICDNNNYDATMNVPDGVAPVRRD